PRYVPPFSLTLLPSRNSSPLMLPPWASNAASTCLPATGRPIANVSFPVSRLTLIDTVYSSGGCSASCRSATGSPGETSHSSAFPAHPPLLVPQTARPIQTALPFLWLEKG